MKGNTEEQYKPGPWCSRSLILCTAHSIRQSGASVSTSSLASATPWTHWSTCVVQSWVCSKTLKQSAASSTAGHLETAQQEIATLGVLMEQRKTLALRRDPVESVSHSPCWWTWTLWHGNWIPWGGISAPSWKLQSITEEQREFGAELMCPSQLMEKKRPKE
jgi:hypothetical protein